MPPKSKADVLADLGLACFKKGDTLKAAGFFEQAVPLVEEDEGNPLLVTLLMNLGVAHTVLGNFEDSARYLEHALALQERQFGPKHAELVGTLQNLVVVSSKLGNAGKAAGFMQRAGEIEEAVKAAEAKAQAEAKVAELEGAGEPRIVELDA
mmetsp:Transcript_73674/g.216183  ORF Transcript_73674/g.216183 Transcript_73674/m.216183 type:complete len:152 (-) Transcript_73674:137-592(-)